MIKFAFSRPFTKTFFILLLIIQTIEVFGKSSTVSAESEFFQKPLQKCWEIDNPLIDGFASDNENGIILFQTDGNIVKLDKNSSEQIWKTSIGNKNNTKVKIVQGEIFAITLDENANLEKLLVVRKIDGFSGIIKNIKEFTDINKEIKEPNSNSLYAFYAKSNSEIGELDLKNSLFKTFSIPSDFKLSENSIVSGDEKYAAFTADNSEISKINKSDPEKKRNIKTESKGITALQISEGSVFWGDDSGNVFKESANRKGFEKILRTGGKVSFLQKIDKNLLITSNDNYLYLYSPVEKKILWKKRLSGRATIEPEFQYNVIAVTTNAEPEIVFVELKNGKTFNQITFPNETFIKNFRLDKNSVYIETNFGLHKFSEECSK